MTVIGSVALTAGLFPFAMSFGQEKPKPEPAPKPEQYSAIWAVLGGGSGGSFSIDIRIDRYSTDEDFRKYAGVLKERGEDGLRKTLEEEDAGKLSTGGNASTTIAIARKHVKDNQTFIRLVTARNLPFVGLRSRGSADYPFTIVDLRLDNDGTGTGTAIAAAGIRFDKGKNSYEIKSMQRGKGYDKLVNVRTR
jgi:hypothetical protein